MLISSAHEGNGMGTCNEPAQHHGDMRFDTPYNQRETPPHHGTPDISSTPKTAGARSWNSWWSRRSPNLKTNDNPPVRIGIDAGSKTIKLVALDENGDVVFADYHRHRSNVSTSLAELLHDIIWRYGDMALPIAFTGSAGIALAKALEAPFVQEVVAASSAVRSRYPQADCIVELGGEDAKITYLGDAPEHRMNATCAGGTGDFIDGIASMLGCKTREISKLALGAQRTYPIASRCAVFARTDVRPLINAGAARADIAQSALEAVVRQTLGGLACGRPIRGTVVFLGGPLEHIPALVMTFRRMLGLTQQTGIKPPDAHLYCAIGAIESASEPPTVSLAELEQQLRKLELTDGETGLFPPLFENAEEQAEFARRHAATQMQTVRLEDAHGPLYLGFDAGSTTMKYALIDDLGNIVAADYQIVEGDILATAHSMIEELLMALDGGSYAKADRYLARSIVTGYGEELLRTGFGFDDGVVETVAHFRAAKHHEPDVSFVLDIGGQDMKALWIRDGQVVDAVLNEACSSGCGAFIQSSAKSLSLSHEGFTAAALAGKHPINLGAKCTVFMTSRVRHAQKAGAAVEDIAAGIAYSVVNNALTRIIGAECASKLEGGKVVVSGGTFKSDAVLRAFEKVTELSAIRPATSHLMGAYGAALIARDDCQLEEEQAANPPKNPVSSFTSLAQLRTMQPRKQSAHCTGCGNACLLSVVDFGNGTHFVSGNRCERAHQIMFDEGTDRQAHAPNVLALEQKLVATFRSTRSTHPRSSTTVGIMNAMNTFVSLPFWHTLFSELGYSVAVADESQVAQLSDHAAETIPSESVCQPAKVSHSRYAALAAQGADVVFMPRYERETRCPVACLYADALADNVEGPRLLCPTLKAIHPQKNARRSEDKRALLEAIKEIGDFASAVSEEEFEEALGLALAAQQRFEDAVRNACDAAFAWAAQDLHRRVAVVAGRPYHIDPALLHDIDRVLAELGFAVVPLLGSSKGSKRTLWKPAHRLTDLVERYANDPQVEIVVLRSFGCGYDAVSVDEARACANKLHRPFTELKIDDITDTAHIRIRLRTLAYTSSIAKAGQNTARTADAHPHGAITPDLCSTAKALVEAAADNLRGHPDILRLKVPDVCKDCLTDALPLELQQLLATTPDIEKTPATGRAACESNRNDNLKIGLLGNPLLVFNPELNEHIEDLLHELGCSVVYPNPTLISVEDVRYLAQIEQFRQKGVQRIIYLQSFGCLKGHIQSRGAARNLAHLYPDMPITVIDYDPESSALNRENRIRLAVCS